MSQTRGHLMFIFIDSFPSQLTICKTDFIHYSSFYFLEFFLIEIFHSLIIKFIELRINTIT